MKLIILISSIFSFFTNTQKSINKLENDNLLQKPSFINDPFILLMFNGSSDLKNHAVFSKFKEVNKRNKKYKGHWDIKVTKSTPFMNDYALIMNGESTNSAISFGLFKPFRFTSKCLVLQYDIRFPNGHNCGGAYIKLLSESENSNMKYFSNLTPYTIMFGPDKCEMEFDIKFIFQYEDPVTKVFQERKFKETEKTFPRFIGDNVTHVYTLMLCENNSVQIFKDLTLIKDGNLLVDFEPALGGTQYIEDITDSKPDDWDDNEEVPDYNAKKPDDWDDDALEFIPDLDAKKPKSWLEKENIMISSNEEEPQDWDEDIDGKWNPPMIRNEKCKKNGCGPWSPPKIRNIHYRGKWSAPFITNVNYKGEWKPRLIENHLFKEQVNAYKKLRPIGNLGIEIFSQTKGIFFDNFLITDNLTSARAFAMHTWWPKFKVDTVDMPQYQEMFNRSKPKSNIGISGYFHWFFASLPLILGIPFLLFISFLIVKKSNRNPELKRERCLLRAYELLRNNKEFYINSFAEENFDSSTLTEVSDEAINQLFGGQNDKIAEIIRKRICHKDNIDKMQSPIGDGL